MPSNENNDEKVTTIKVRGETWTRLNVRKRPGDSFDDVVWRLLEASEGNRAGVATETEILTMAMEARSDGDGDP